LWVHDDYLIGRQIPLSVLAELAAAMLDALEVHFVLYAQADSPSSAAPIAGSHQIATDRNRVKARALV
jgi:hypothetical protein